VARNIEPVSKAGSLRVLEEAGPGRYRTIEIQAGPLLITAACPLPGDLRQALVAITSPCPSPG
jgi:hypothetical protein